MFWNRKLLSAITTAWLLNDASAFAPTSFASRTATTRLASSLAVNDDLHYRQMISKARECAFSDTSSAGDARMFLHEILRLEEGCVSGNLSGDICENIDEVADIVSHLRVKAESSAADVSAPQVVVTLMSTTALLMVAAVLLTTVGTPGSEATPYTVQEWVWATQGGYLDNMVAHFMRNGGL